MFSVFPASLTGFIYFPTSCLILQPQIYLFRHDLILQEYGLFNIPWLEILLLPLTIPLWSICFGWIYVKFTNWLNHFPVLGKKVF